MHSPDQISFLCPSCSTLLSVPQNLAGVTGPCPSCRILIEAPFPAPEMFHDAAPQPQQYVQPTPQHEAYAPAPQPDYYHREPQPVPQQSAILRPEPRQLPNRSDPVEAPTRIRSEPSGEFQPRLGQPSPLPQRHHRSLIMRFLVPLAFLCIALGVIYGVKTILQMEPGKSSANGTGTKDGDPSSAALEPIHPPEDETFESLTANDRDNTIPVGQPHMPEIGDVGEDHPPEIQPVDGGIAALSLLEDFLGMKSLEERLPHLESRLTEPELSSSVLNGPLPEALKITVDVRETNAIEQVTDYYYLVDFSDGSEGVNPQTMLVRTRGTSPPKVVVDPFLDLYGGRFERYAEKPTEDAGTFQVIISAGAFCYDDVPGPEKKFTLKILAREDTKEIAKAYFGKRSKIGDMLEDETSGLAYGQAKACTLFMRWNMDEDPENPFLEALDIKAMNWNP